jgi:hypothetical protein
MKKVEVWERSVEQISKEIERAASIMTRFATRVNETADLLGPEAPATQVREAEELLYEGGDVLSLLADSLRCLNEDVVCVMLKP